MVTSKWHYFRQMDFIRNIIRPGSRNSNLETDETDPVLDDDNDSMNLGNESQFSPTADEDQDVPVFPPRPLLPPSHSSNCIFSGPSTSRDHTGEKGLKRRLSLRERIDKRNEELVWLEKRKVELLEMDEKEIEDDDVQFLHSLLPFIKKLPDIQRLRLRSKIQTLVLEEFEKVHNSPLDIRPNSPASDNISIHSQPGISTVKKKLQCLDKIKQFLES